MFILFNSWGKNRCFSLYISTTIDGTHRAYWATCWQHLAVYSKAIVTAELPVHGPLSSWQACEKILPLNVTLRGLHGP